MAEPVHRAHQHRVRDGMWETLGDDRAHRAERSNNAPEARKRTRGRPRLNHVPKTGRRPPAGGRFLSARSRSGRCSSDLCTMWRQPPTPPGEGSDGRGRAGDNRLGVATSLRRASRGSTLSARACSASRRSLNTLYTDRAGTHGPPLARATPPPHFLLEAKPHEQRATASRAAS